MYQITGYYLFWAVETPDTVVRPAMFFCVNKGLTCVARQLLSANRVIFFVSLPIQRMFTYL